MFDDKKFELMQKEEGERQKEWVDGDGFTKDDLRLFDKLLAIEDYYVDGSSILDVGEKGVMKRHVSILRVKVFNKLNKMKG